MSKNQTPHEMPDLGPADMVAIFGDLPPEELLRLDHDTGRWQCCVHGCPRYTSVHDFGLFPIVFWRKKWLDLRRNLFFCSKHYPLLRVKSDITYKTPELITKELVDIFGHRFEDLLE